MRALIFLLFVLPAAADHIVKEIQCPPHVQYRIVRDMNGDGLDDFLVVTPVEVWIWHGRKDSLPAAPDARMKLPVGTGLFHVGRWRNRRPSLLVRTPARYLRLGGQQAVARSGPGLPEHSANVLWRKLFTDVDGDGTPDIVDVSLDGYRILFGDKSEVLLPPLLMERAVTDVDAASDRMLARIAFAEWHTGEFNGDNHPDFAVMTPGGLLVYPGDARGRPDPSRRLTILIPEAKEADLTLLDFNLDGRTDALAVEADAGRATILLSDPEKGMQAPKRRRLTVPGQMRDTIVSDFDNDGRPDLALPYVPKLGFQDILRVVARREVVLRVPIFMNKGGRKVFGARADSQIGLPVRVRVKTDSIGRILLGGLVIVEYEGDLDGDGRRDLLVTDTPTRLAIHPGRPGRVFSENASAHIVIPDCSVFESVRSVAADLNGDQFSDIILHYRGAGRRPDRLYLLWSRKR